MGSSPQIIDISQAYKLDEEFIGKKAHEVGALWKLGIPLSRGFIITTEFFKEFLRLTGIDKEIRKIKTFTHSSTSTSLINLLHPIQKLIMHHPIPQSLSAELHKSYRELSGVFKEAKLNICSSSNGNKIISFVNVEGDANLILKIKTIWSRSIENPVTIIAQENIESKTRGMIATNELNGNLNLSKSQVADLAKYCGIIQKHFYFPKEIKYTVKNNKIVITGVKDFTGSAKSALKVDSQDNAANKKLIKGISINPGIVTGSVKVLNNPSQKIEIKKGEIAVMSNLNPALFKEIKNAKAVVVDSILSNAANRALFRHSFHFPTIEGAKSATKVFRNGNIVTVNGLTGEIYSGGLI